MAKRFSQEFKQQIIEYALSNSHELLAVIAKRLGGGYSTLDKWVREENPIGSRKRQLTPEQQRILDLEKEVKQLKEANDILKNGMCTFSQIKAREVHSNQRLCDEKSSSYCSLQTIWCEYIRFLCLEKTSNMYNKAMYWQHHARLGAPSLVHDMHDLGYGMSERTVGQNS